MSTTQPVNDTSPNQKKQLSAEEIRKRRKERAAARRQRILAGSVGDGDRENVRLQYVKGLTSTDTLKKAEHKTYADSNVNEEHTTFIRDALNAENNGHSPRTSQRQHPHQQPNLEDFMQSMSSMSSMDASGGLPRIDPNADMNDMLQQMFAGLLGEGSGGGHASAAATAQRNKEMMEYTKRKERLQKYDSYLHDVFAVVFAVILVFIPYEFDVTLFGYNLLSDSWSFFIALEMILFSIMYGYQYVMNPQTHKNEDASMNAAGPLLSMFGLGIGASLLGASGGEMMQRIQTWMHRMTMIWNYIKMLRQMMSDLCVVLFLWIILTAAKSVFVSLMS